MSTTQIRARYRKGERVTMTTEALENYGEKWRNVPLIITHTATAYMPADQFYRQGKPSGYHPGFDDSANCALYDLKRADTGEPVNFSLYEWELS